MKIEDLYLMSCCNYQIISNSSYSWWSSYLNNNENKIILTPYVWFGEFTPKDIYRNDMVIIKF